MIEIEEVYMLTQSVWNPCCDAYATNKESIFEWEDNMIKKRESDNIFLSNIPKDNAMIAYVQISRVDSAVINQVLQRGDHVLEEKSQPYWMPINQAVY